METFATQFWNRGCHASSFRSDYEGWKHTSFVAVTLTSTIIRFRSDYEGWKRTTIVRDLSNLPGTVLEVTMRDGNFTGGCFVKLGQCFKGFRSDYEGWKLVIMPASMSVRIIWF